METFGEEISAEACSGKEIAGLLKKMMMMMMMMMKKNMIDNIYDDTKIVKIACERILAWKTGGRWNELGLCTARYESKSCC